MLVGPSPDFGHITRYEDEGHFAYQGQEAYGDTAYADKFLALKTAWGSEECDFNYAGADECTMVLPATAEHTPQIYTVNGMAGTMDPIAGTYNP